VLPAAAATTVVLTAALAVLLLGSSTWLLPPMRALQWLQRLSYETAQSQRRQAEFETTMHTFLVRFV
jgi:hypothetical protein